MLAGAGGGDRRALAVRASVSRRTFFGWSKAFYGSNQMTLFWGACFLIPHVPPFHCLPKHHAPECVSLFFSFPRASYLLLLSCYVYLYPTYRCCITTTIVSGDCSKDPIPDSCSIRNNEVPGQKVCLS